MRKPFILFLAGMLASWTVTAQPVLQISANGNGTALSWAGGVNGYFYLQTTTNLTRPIVWTNLTFSGNAGSFSNSTATASSQFFRLAQVMPIFQFAIFYNLEMEICPGPAMTFTGPVFANGPIYASPSGTLTFANSVKTTSAYIHGIDSANDPQSPGSGTILFAVPPYVAQTNQPPLSLLIGTNANSILQLPPRGTDPHSITGQLYLVNEVDIIVSNSVSGILTASYQDSNNVPPLTFIPYDVTNIVGSVTNKYYSFVTNVSFFDYRESDTVKAVQINVGKFNSWLTNIAGGLTYSYQNFNDKGHAIDSIYVYNSIPLTSAQLPAVRMTNGAIILSQGLTVATPQPIYVIGNYNASSSDLLTTNTADTAPAALMGDAVTILSSQWNDAQYTATHDSTYTSRPAANTTVNAAVFEGIVPSTHVGSTKYYSGGVENFLRLMEDWGASGGQTLQYNGAIVVMFASQYATNHWVGPGSPGNVYYQPNRRWAFDLNFQNWNGLPPLTPSVVNLVTP